jgi:hypothetical protein
VPHDIRGLPAELASMRWIALGLLGPLLVMVGQRPDSILMWIGFGVAGAGVATLSTRLARARQGLRAAGPSQAGGTVGSSLEDGGGG